MRCQQRGSARYSPIIAPKNGRFATSFLLRCASTLVLPLAFLLFVQWPLRDVVQAGSREANDLGQVLFALYVAAAVTAATRERAHLASDFVAHRYPARVRAWLSRAASLLVAAPAAAFTLYASASGTWHSLLQLERFPETFNPGYFLVRFAAFALAALVLVQALRDGFLAPRASRLAPAESR